MKPVEIPLQQMAPRMPRAARILLSLLPRLRYGRLELTAPGGECFRFQGTLPGPDARLVVHDWTVFGAVLRSGDIGFAETYIAEKWDTPNLTALLQLAVRNRAVLEATMRGKWWGKLLYRLRHLLRSNTRANARRNIHAHYDLGNDFYGSWLDPTMTYSSALFAGAPNQSLEQAQLAKYRRILEQLNVRAGDRILEIGCGWGGFAEVAARERGAHVHGITLSNEQLDFCRRRFKQAGLEDRVRTQLIDYRDVDGNYDFVVSIEMIEAVGEAYWPSYFQVVRERLRRGGRALIQTIVIADELFENYRRSTDFIQQYVFPGGMLPSPSAFDQQATRAGLTVDHRYFFGPDYAKTLNCWRERFNAALPALRNIGIDTPFERLWHFYLAYCEAGFLAGSIDVAQMELTRD